MEQRSVLSLPLIFWNKSGADIKHQITALAVSGGHIATGSTTGDIVMWRVERRKCIPQIIATPNIDLECRQLVFVTPPFAAAIDARIWLASLHDDSRIRVWEWDDGRCVSASAHGLLTPLHRATRMCGIQKRLLAVGGDDCVVHIIDSWTLTKLSTYRLPGALVDLCTQDSQMSTNLAALCSNDQVLLWTFSDVSEFLIDPRCPRPMDSHPSLKLTIRTTQPPRKIAISTDGSLLAICYESLISFLHEDWFLSESRDEAYMRTSSPVVSLMFTEDALIVVQEDGSLAEYDIMEVLQVIGVSASSPVKVMERRGSVGAVFNFDDKSIGGAVNLSEVALTDRLTKARRFRRTMTDPIPPETLVSSLSSFGQDAKCLAFNEDFLYIAKQNSIYTCKLDSLLTGEAFEVSFVSLMGCNPHFLADSQLQFLLEPEESITDSHLIMAHAWPLYCVGTSRGRVFVVPLAAAHAIRCLDAGTSDAISCLLHYHNLLISCSWNGTIQVWSLSMKDLKGERDEEEVEREEPLSARSCSSDSGQLIDPSQHLPLKTFHIPYTRLTVLKQLHFIREAVEDLDEEEWKQKWIAWQRILIGQLEDNTVLLLSMDERSVLCAFHGMRGLVKEALVHIPFDYLFLNCSDGDCYVFSMTTQQLERIIPAYAIPYRAFRRAVAPAVFEEVDETRSIPQQLLDLNMHSLATHHSLALVWVEYPTLGQAQFPVLCLNVGQITQSFAEMSECPEQAEFIISLLYSWHQRTDDAEVSFQAQLQEIFKVAEPSVIAHLGTFGVENSVSFRLPAECSRWEISTHISALISTSLLSVLAACVNFRPNLKLLLGKKIDTHIQRLKHRVKAFQRPSPFVLAFEAISGNQIAYALLKKTLSDCSKEEKDAMAKEWKRILDSAVVEFEDADGKEKRLSIDQWWSQRPIRLLTISEAMSVLSLCALSLSHTEIEQVSDLVTNLSFMLRHENTGYVLTAALLIHDGARKWRPRVHRDLCAEVTIWLLHLYHTGKELVRNCAKKALLSIGKADVPLFCDVLKHEVMKITHDRDYPDTVLTTLEVLITKHARHVLMSLPSLVEVILRSLDPREILLRKICISKATDVLDTMVKSLPMVSFEPERQLLAIGTSGCHIEVYDLKSATLWKELSSHSGPVSAVSFSPSGTHLVSYSIADTSVKFWKIEKSFLGLGSLQMELERSVEVGKVQSAVRTTGELLQTLAVRWDEAGAKVTREDKKTYSFAV